MTRYAERSDLPRHGIAAPLLAVIPTADQDDALDTASEEADDYLRERFALPLTAWSRSLRKHVCAMAAYELQSVRGYNIDSSDKILKERYDAAIRWLEKCSLSQLTPNAVEDSTPEDDSDNDVSFCISNARRGWIRR